MESLLSVLAKVNFTPPAPKGSHGLKPFEGWPVENGKRVPPPEQYGRHFLLDLRFDEDPWRADYVLGLFIEWLEVSEDGLNALIRFALRADDDGAFTKYLHPSSKFELFAGYWNVATGEVLSDPEAAPIRIKLGPPGGQQAK